MITRETIIKGNSIILKDKTVGTIESISPHRKFIIVEFQEDGNTRHRTIFLNNIETHGSEQYEMPSS